MARGHYWQAFYEIDQDDPADAYAFAGVAAGAQINNRRITSATGQPVAVRWRRDHAQRCFLRCDFVLTVGPESFVTNCFFDRCRFKSSVWEGVRFSNCRFERCDFSEATIKRCYFVNNCTFERNTASPQKFRIEETAISASAFMAGLQPNLDAETPALVRYSRCKFIETRQKVAKAIYSATRNEPDVDYFFEAYEELTRVRDWGQEGQGLGSRVRDWGQGANLDRLTSEECRFVTRVATADVRQVDR